MSRKPRTALVGVLVRAAALVGHPEEGTEVQGRGVQEHEAVRHALTVAARDDHAHGASRPGAGTVARYPVRVEDLDRHIVDLLAKDGRISFTDLGKALGMSTSAVHQRVRRLEQRGVINGYAASSTTPRRSGSR